MVELIGILVLVYTLGVAVWWLMRRVYPYYSKR